MIVIIVIIVIILAHTYTHTAIEIHHKAPVMVLKSNTNNSSPLKIANVTWFLSSSTNIFASAHSSRLALATASLP